MRLETALPRLCLAICVLTLAHRLHPVLLGGDRLAQFFVTEDGYLMLTVARNLAIGNGLSVSAGEIPTNGVQPLATLLFAVPYLVTGGEKLASLVGIHLISAAIAVAGGVAVWRFARLALGPQDVSPAWPALAATLWFAGPLLVGHSMNALETGLYSLAVVGALLYFARLMAAHPREPFPMGARLLLGLLCGVVFLARIDGAFLVAAILGTRFLQAQIAGGLSFRQAVAEGLPAGLVSLAVAAPWLVHNHLLFGSIMPISGFAQSHSAVFGSNAALAPIKFFETAFPMLPVPQRFEGILPLGLVLGVASLACLAVFVAMSLRRAGHMGVVVLAYALFAAMILVYYGLFFGAAHFLSRYFAPLAPLLIVAVVSVGLGLATRLAHRLSVRPALAAAGIGAVLLCLALNLRLVLPGGHQHEHFQVVGWVEDNLEAADWVGAVQTGTLGYWHDRTVNLDGKVNPYALAARQRCGSVLAYVAASRIDHLADWVGIARWAENLDGGFSERFELVLRDPAANLAVLRRRDTGWEGPPSWDIQPSCEDG